MTINQYETITKFVQRVAYGASGRFLGILILFFVVQAGCIQKINAQDKDVTVTATGQNARKISGKVTDDKGEVLPGVTVKIKGTSTGTITDANGSFSLDNVTSNETVIFSFIGMQSREVKVDEQNMINIKLSESAAVLDEVVVVGYGVQKKVTLTGAVGLLISITEIVLLAKFAV